MRVKARKHARNEGSLWFKSAPLRQRVWLLRQSPGNSAKMAVFVARFERLTEPERDEYRRHSARCECFSPHGHRLVRFRNCFG
jgi:hypothetical protein